MEWGYLSYNMINKIPESGYGHTSLMSVAGSMDVNGFP